MGWRTEITYIDRNSGEISMKRPDFPLHNPVTVSKRVHVDWDTQEHVVQRVVHYNKRYLDAIQSEIKI